MSFTFVKTTTNEPLLKLNYLFIKSYESAIRTSDNLILISHQQLKEKKKIASPSKFSSSPSIKMQYKVSPLPEQQKITKNTEENTDFYRGYSNYPKRPSNSYNGILFDCIVFVSFFGDGKQQIIELCEALGATYINEYSDIVQYIITDGIDLDIRKIASDNNKTLIHYRWLCDCAKLRCKTDINVYLL